MLCKKWHILGQFLSIWGVVRFCSKAFLYIPKYCKKGNSPKLWKSQLAGEPLEPLGYFCIRLMSGVPAANSYFFQSTLSIYHKSG